MIDDLEEKWASWHQCLEGEDINSIFSQITLLTWDAAIFRMIIDARRMQIEANPDQPKISLHLHQFIDRTFFQSQVSCIRRLIEPSKHSSLYGSKGVYSLSALLKDIASVRPKLTRETFFRLRNLPYNYQEIIKGENAFVIEQNSRGKFSSRLSPAYDWEDSADAHILFDRLSNTSQRSPTDIIQERVFKKLVSKLDSFEHLTKYVDKYIAHAATPISRQADNVDEETITWKYLWDSHQSLYEIAEFLALILSGVEHVPLAWKSPCLFEFWDAPFVPTNNISQLELAWDKFENETEDWRLNGNLRIWSSMNI